MAEAREGCGGAGSLEAELACPICLSLCQEPVSLSCGHKFCRQCIEKVLGAQQRSQSPCTCPMCRAHLGPAMELQNNLQVGDIAEAFQATASQVAQRENLQEDEGSEKGKTEVVPCEYCLDGPMPAVKTCLACNVSLCQAHLSKHNAKASQEEHILVEVGAGTAEERRCREHGRLLEFFCLREDKCICMLCSIVGAHKGHEVVTMKEGRKVKLSNTTTRLKECKRVLVTTLEELQKSENQLKTNTKTVTSQLQEQFEKIRTELTEKEKNILRSIQSYEERQLAGIAETRKEMENKRQLAEQNLEVLQKTKEQPDVFLFFKELKLITDRLASLDLGPRMVRVLELQEDSSRTVRFQRLREDFMAQVDSVLQFLCIKLKNQVQWSSEVSATGTAPNVYETALSEALARQKRRKQHLYNEMYKK